jgi:pimeloyl-ACP methyl ester carboxylesterase
VLVLQGAQDEYGTIRQIDSIRARVPSAEWMLLENCKHAPHREQPELVLQQIAGFMAELQ